MSYSPRYLVVMPTRTVDCHPSAQAALDYFNAFHDGFMQRITITSQDRILEDQSQTCTGLFHLEIDFAHYNYPAPGNPFHPHDQLIRAQFHDVRDIRLHLTTEFLGNTIISLTIEPAPENRLEFRLGRHAYLPAENRYEFRESPIFTFTTAEFTELKTRP
jgi:hypothetical protein